MGFTTGKTNGQMEILIIGKQKISHSANSRPMSVGEHHPAFKRFNSQMRSSLLPDAAASAPAFADRFWDWIVNEGGWGRMAGKTDVNNREMRCFQSCAVFFGLHGSVYLPVFSRGKTSGVVEILSEETLVGEIHSL